MRWRWDQGRLDYFNFDNLKRIASTLVNLEGVSLKTQGFDPLREPLILLTGLPFAPTHYKVWRNYARIFKWTLLASNIGDSLVVTDVCKKIASTDEESWDVDRYLSFLIPRLYYPSPATQDYNVHEEQTFPLCTILRYLIAQFKQRGEASISLDQVFSYLAGNRVKGTEELETYLSLVPTSRKPQGDEARQVREMMIFLG